jgi:hypothetical protein
MSPEQADYLLDEWVRWQSEDVINNGWPRATSFGKAIKPDPRPATLPIDDERAARTDKAVSGMPQRIKSFIRLHYMDRSPISKKAQRLRCTEHAYRLRHKGVLTLVAMLLTDRGWRSKQTHSADVRP